MWLRIGSLVFLLGACCFGEALSWSCAFKTLTGLPCATCGMTRAWRLAAAGDLPAACAQSPLGVVLFVAAIAVLVLPVRRVRFDWLFAALAVNWMYALLSGIA